MTDIAIALDLAVKLRDELNEVQEALALQALAAEHAGDSERQVQVGVIIAQLQSAEALVEDLGALLDDHRGDG